MPRYFVLRETIDKDTEFLLAGGRIEQVALHCLAAFATAAALDHFIADSLAGIRRAIQGRERAQAALRDTAVIPAADLIRYHVAGIDDTA
jgi:hypothetical protein